MADQQQQRQRQSWSGPDFSIVSFEVPDNSIKVNEDFTLVAVVAYRRHGPPHQSQHVVFEDNGREIGEAPTDGEGRAELDYSFTTHGPHRLTAQIRSIPVSRVRRQINVKAPEKPEDPVVVKLKQRVALLGEKKNLAEKRRELAAVVRPSEDMKKLKKLESKTTIARADKALRELVPTQEPPTTFEFYARPQGPSKEYYVTAAVGAKGVVVEIFDPANSKQDQRRVVKKSGSDGTVRLHVNTNGPRELSAFVPMAPNLPTIELRLAGPEEEVKPVEFPPVPNKVLKGSLFDAFRWGWRNGMKTI